MQHQVWPTTQPTMLNSCHQLNGTSKKKSPCWFNHRLESTSATLPNERPSTNRHCHNLLIYLWTASTPQSLAGTERVVLLLPNCDQCSVCGRRAWEPEPHPTQTTSASILTDATQTTNICSILFYSIFIIMADVTVTVAISGSGWGRNH